MTKVIIKAADGTGAVELFHDAAKKIETAAGGTIVTGAIQVNNTGGNGLTVTSPTNECNIILTNDARSWKIVNYDYSVGNDNLGFHDGTADRMIVKNNGNVQIPDGDLEIADGHGIDFASTSDAAGKTSELFNDYEEGTWTPDVNGRTSAGPGTQSGSYTKIGRQVTAWFHLDYGATLTSSQTHLKILGLPFTAATGSVYGATGGMHFNNSWTAASDRAGLHGLVPPGTGYIDIYCIYTSTMTALAVSDYGTGNILTYVTYNA